MASTPDHLERARRAHERARHLVEETAKVVAVRAAAVRAAHDAGLTWAEIGAALGVSDDRARMMAFQPGLPPPRPK